MQNEADTTVLCKFAQHVEQNLRQQKTIQHHPTFSGQIDFNFNVQKFSTHFKQCENQVVTWIIQIIYYSVNQI